MKLGPLGTRRRYKWAATALSAVLILVYIASVRCSLSLSLDMPGHRLVIVGVYRGALGATRFESRTPPEELAWTFRYHERPAVSMRWWLKSGSVVGKYEWYSVPMWIMLAPPLWIGLWLWRCDLRFADYCCRECGYDLRGLDGGVCPECGKASR